jgi:uroporphyrinogen III methyltransferase/synthase
VVLGRQRDARLTAIFSSLDRRRDYGRVWLVGFGPGDPDLMTVKARRVLRSANVIFYDDLIDQSILGRYRARSVYVGKRKGRSHGRQEAINRMLYQSAIRGETVVRLKGGDPFVLGRGGEELDYLERRFVSVDVVPGVTSALAAAADFGIPLTRRGMSRGVEIRTGHTDCPGVRPERCETSVYYMAASRLGGLREELLSAGVDPDLPAAIVEKASLPGRRCRFTKIRTLASEQAVGPALLLVGPTVNAAVWRPTLLYTGTSPHRFRGPERLVHYPLIERRGRKEVVGVEKPRIDLQELDGVAFTHELAVRLFLEIWGSLPDLVYATNAPLYRLLTRDYGCRWVVRAWPARVCGY